MKKYFIIVLGIILSISAIYFYSDNKNNSNEIKNNDKNEIYIKLPTYDQHKEGYPLGCEGISLYMCLVGLNYIDSTKTDVQAFMKTMPLSNDENPQNGYVGDPTIKSGIGVNKGKRTTLYPSPLTKWANQYGEAISRENSEIEVLEEDLKNNNPVIVYMTGNFEKCQWQKFSFGNAVINNHALVLVGINDNGNYIVNDCSHGKGVYTVNKDKFKRIYNERKFAVTIIHKSHKN